MSEESVEADESRASEGGAGAPPEPESPNRAPDLTREYSTPDITVQWFAGRCIHSANCVRALQRVFDPQRRPWVEPAAAPADAIADAVLRCPTGALHFVRHDGGLQEVPDVPAKLTPIRRACVRSRSFSATGNMQRPSSISLPSPRASLRPKGVVGSSISRSCARKNRSCSSSRRCCPSST